MGGVCQMTKQFILSLAISKGWTFPIENQPNPLMLSFFKGDARINVYYTTMTVSTAITHPKHGKCQMYRRDVTQRQLTAIFQNPRVHIGTGYHRKPVDHMGEQKDALNDYHL